MLLFFCNPYPLNSKFEYFPIRFKLSSFHCIYTHTYVKMTSIIVSIYVCKINSFLIDSYSSTASSLSSHAYNLSTDLMIHAFYCPIGQYSALWTDPDATVWSPCCHASYPWAPTSHSPDCQQTYEQATHQKERKNLAELGVFVCVFLLRVLLISLWSTMDACHSFFF